MNNKRFYIPNSIIFYYDFELITYAVLKEQEYP